MTLPHLQVSPWREIPGLVHGFFGRAGGVSEGGNGSLNLGAAVGDDPARVAENWARVRRSVADLPIITPRQEHGTKVVAVASAQQVPGAADALVTRERGVAVGVLTADCVPLLMVAPASHVVLVVHAGWRGTVAGIARIAVEEACRCYGIRPADLQVALGPSIGGCCYQVETRIGQEMEAQWGAMPDAWWPAGERGMLDLRRANERVLVRSGVPRGQIVDIGPCTACCPEQFFSHRRSEGHAGRQLSVIGWL